VPRSPARETPNEASFFVSLYRAERAAALARGVDLTHEHPHPFVHFRDGNPNHTWRPSVAIGDGCYCMVTT
jgi:hypothetical protein